MLHNFFCFSCRELHSGVAEKASKIMFTKLEDKVKGTPVPVVLRSCKNRAYQKAHWTDMHLESRGSSFCVYCIEKGEEMNAREPSRHGKLVNWHVSQKAT